jgi:hypothetical protein
MAAIEAVKDFEKTIDKVTTRYRAVAEHLGKLDIHGDPRKAIPYLIDLIRTLKGVEKMKIERDLDLVKSMKQITLQLHAAGYHIV